MVLCLVVTACVEQYSPVIEKSDLDLMVVSGLLDTSDSTALIVLSRTRDLVGDTARRWVQSATVTIDDENGSSFDLTETSAGHYRLDRIPVNVADRYRVRIVSSGEEYVSDFVAGKATPPIDSVVWRAGHDETVIQVNTHDDTGLARYYKWDYVETYEYDAAYFSQFEVVNLVPVPRKPDEYVFTCWKTIASEKIFVNSTVQLRGDVVHDFPLTAIPAGSIKLSKKYSILVKQRALSEEEFAFYDQLQKVTEGIGGIFDPQPSQLPGNIHAVNNGADALGYFSVGSSTSLRMFINYVELPNDLRWVERPQCGVDTFCVIPNIFKCLKNVDELNGTESLIGSIYGQSGVLGYTTGTPYCTDCQVAGGVLRRPLFWD